MPLNFINGLPFLPMRPYTDEEWTKLPHVLLTADRKWDPRVLDGNIDDIEEWSAMFDHVVGDTAKAPEERPRDMKDNPFDENGYYIDWAMKQKDPPIARIQEDAHRIYAQKMEGIHELDKEANIMETVVLHAEDSGDDPYVVPPIDSDREDTLFGNFLANYECG